MFQIKLSFPISIELLAGAVKSSYLYREGTHELEVFEDTVGVFFYWDTKEPDTLVGIREGAIICFRSLGIPPGIRLELLRGLLKVLTSEEQKAEVQELLTLTEAQRKPLKIEDPKPTLYHLPGLPWAWVKLEELTKILGHEFCSSVWSQYFELSQDSVSLAVVETNRMSYSEDGLPIWRIDHYSKQQMPSIYAFIPANWAMDVIAQHFRGVDGGS